MAMASHEELKGAESDLNQLLMIKAYLAGVHAVYESLEAADCSSKLLIRVLEKCGPRNTAPVAALIAENIEPDAIYSKAPIDVRNNRLWAVKVSLLPATLVSGYFC
jgi:DNA mismatch repair protein MSH4